MTSAPFRNVNRWQDNLQSLHRAQHEKPRPGKTGALRTKGLGLMAAWLSSPPHSIAKDRRVL
jgi:hypothetical protein